jgi:hypothetical protein
MFASSIGITRRLFRAAADISPKNIYIHPQKVTITETVTIKDIYIYIYIHRTS